MAELDELAKRPGWTVDGQVATFAPGTGWRAVVRSVRLPGKTYSLWHIALVEGSTARHVLRAHDLDQAVRLARGADQRSQRRIAPHLLEHVYDPRGNIEHGEPIDVISHRSLTCRGRWVQGGTGRWDHMTVKIGDLPDGQWFVEVGLTARAYATREAAWTVARNWMDSRAGHGNGFLAIRARGRRNRPYWASISAQRRRPPRPAPGCTPRQTAPAPQHKPHSTRRQHGSDLGPV